MESDVDLFQTIGSDRMVEPLWVVVLPFQPASLKRGEDCTTTLRLRDDGAVVVGPPPR